MDKEQFLKTGLLEQYVLGLTDEEESALVEKYAESFPEISQEIESMRKALEEYAMQYVAMPPEELKSKVMNAVDEEISAAGQPLNNNVSKAGVSSWIRALPSVLLLLCMVALGGVAYLFYQGKNVADQRYEKLSIAFEVYKADCESRQQSAIALEEIYQLLQHYATQPVRLSGSAISPEAEAVAYLNPVAEKALINLTKLPEPPKGKTYQLWADVEGHMINMGVIDANEDDFQIVTYITGAESLNITLEPDGGSTEPTVELLYVNGKV